MSKSDPVSHITKQIQILAKLHDRKGKKRDASSSMPGSSTLDADIPASLMDMAAMKEALQATFKTFSNARSTLAVAKTIVEDGIHASTHRIQGISILESINNQVGNPFLKDDHLHKAYCKTYPSIPLNNATIGGTASNYIKKSQPPAVRKKQVPSSTVDNPGTAAIHDTGLTSLSETTDESSDDISFTDYSSALPPLYNQANSVQVTSFQISGTTKTGSDPRIGNPELDISDDAGSWETDISGEGEADDEENYNDDENLG